MRYGLIVTALALTGLLIWVDLAHRHNSQLGEAEIRAEDAEVIEAALVGHWELGKTSPGTICSETAEPWALGDAIVQGFGKRPIAKVDPVAKQMMCRRNASSASLAWLHPKSPWLSVGTSKSLDPWGALNQARILLPGYSADFQRAIFCFAEPASPHTIRVTTWLTKSERGWKVVDTRQEWYP